MYIYSTLPTDENKDYSNIKLDIEKMAFLNAKATYEIKRDIINLLTKNINGTYEDFVNFYQKTSSIGRDRLYYDDAQAKILWEKLEDGKKEEL